MRTMIGGFAVLALTGCATPTELMQSGVRAEYSLRLPAEAAARCLERNAENYPGGPGAQTRSVEPTGTWEVTVRSDQLLAVARITAVTSGSRATIWRGRIPVIAWGLPNAMVEGC